MKKLLLILVMSFVCVNYGFADLQSFLLEKYHQTKNSFQELPSNTEFGNIYNSALESERNMEFYNTKEGLDGVLINIKSSYPQCAIMSTNDIYNLYSYTEEGKETMKLAKSFKGQKEGTNQCSIQNLTIVPDEKFIKSCMKLNYCSSGKEVSIGKEIDTSKYTRSMYVDCVRLVSETYLVTKSLADMNNGTNMMVYSDDQFTNGSLEDSSYDLLVDVSEIGKLLFEKHEEAKSMSFDAMPLDAMSRSGDRDVLANMFEKILPRYSEDQTKPVGGAGNSNGGNGIITKDDIDKLKYDINQLEDQLGDFDNSIYKDVNILGNDQCRDQGDGDTDFLSGDFDDGGNSSDYVTGTQLIDDIMYSNLSGDALSGALGDLSDTLFGGKLDPNVPSISAGDVKKCMINSSWNDIFAIKVCWIPSKVKGIVANKSVLSVEEMVVEMVNVLRKLEQSGKAMPHKKTDEAYDFSFEDIELKEIFSFDMILTWKPLFDKRDEDADDQKNKQELDTVIKEVINPDQNTYIDMLGNWNYYLASAYDLPKNDNKDYNEILKIYARTLSSINNDVSFYEDVNKETQNYKYLKNYAYFVEKNISFWDSVSVILREISDIAEAQKTELESQ